MAVNPATDHLFGYARDELVGRSIDRIVVGEDGGVLAHIAAVDTNRFLHGAPHRRVEFLGRHRDGHSFTVEFTATAIRQPHEEYVLCVMRESPTPPPVDAMDAAYREAAHGLASFQRDLLAELARGHGATGIATALHRRSGRKVLVLDASGDVLAASGEWPTTVGPRDRPVLDPEHAVHGVPERSGNYWTSAARPDRILLGSISILDPSGSLGESDLLALEQAASILSAELLHLHGVPDVDDCSHAELAREVLDGCSPARIRSYAAALGYDIDAAYVAVAIELDGVGPASADTIAHVARECGARSPLVASWSDRTIFLTSDPIDWCAFVTGLDTAFGATTRLGIGDPRPLDEARDSTTEALFALDVGTTLRCDNPVTSFGDLGVWRILLDTTDTTKLTAFVHEWIGALIEYDHSHGLELVKTLTVYLEGACGIESAAQALFVHRNTLRYRLTKISQILGRDLADADDRFQLELACRAWTVLQALDEEHGPADAEAS
jgi:PAS domain S-box-containing protein